jgi:hypothetical protein
MSVLLITSATVEIVPENRAWVWRLVPHTKGRTQIEEVWERGAEDNIGPKREEVAGGWRKLHSEELYNLYASSNIISVIKSKCKGLVGHVARTGGISNG